MANKVEFGFSTVKYAIYDASTGEYGTPVAFPGGVSLSLTREGGDSSDFYADNGVYYTFAGTNGGYSADLEMAHIPESVRVALLGEIFDTTAGMYVEVTNPQDIQFALICERQGDANPEAYCFYNCKASRIEMNANTKNDSPDVDTETLNLRIAAQNFTMGGVERGVVQSHIEKTSENTAKYTAFLAGVVTPTA